MVSVTDDGGLKSIVQFTLTVTENLSHIPEEVLGRYKAESQEGGGETLALAASIVTTAPLQCMFMNGLPPNLTEATELMNYMTEMGFTTVIVTAVRVKPDGENPCLNSYKWTTNYTPSNLNNLLSAAKNAGKSVILGLNMVTNSHKCELAKPFVPFYNYDDARADIAANFPMLKSACDSYAPACTGWYLADEPQLTTWHNPSAAHAYYKYQVNQIREYDKARDILVSPPLACAKDPVAVKDLAVNFSNATGVNIQMWQDSVGYCSQSIDSNQRSGPRLDRFYYELKLGLGGSLWAVTELFNWGTLPTYGYAGNYHPASARRLARQLSQASTAYVSQRAAWLPGNHLSTNGFAADGPMAEAPRFKATYKAMYRNDGELMTPFQYRWSTPPSATYSDSGNEMFDGVVGDPLNHGASGWVGVPAYLNNGSELLIDLGTEKTVRWVGVHTLRNAGSGIFIPDQIQLWCNDSGHVRIPNGTANRPDKVKNYNGTNSEDRNYNSEYVIGNTSAMNYACRYLDLILTGDTGWHFLSEVEIVTN